MLFDKDAGHSQFMEEVYECQSRLPGGIWNAATIPWADVVSLQTNSILASMYTVVA